MSSIKSLRGRDQAGFSLLEILVAFAVLSISLGVIFQIYSGGLVGVARSELSSKAAIIAASQMARVGTELELEEGEYSEDAMDGLHWNIHITPYQLPDVSLVGVQLYKIDVEVSHTEDEQFSYAATTLRMADE